MQGVSGIKALREVASRIARQKRCVANSASQKVLERPKSDSPSPGAERSLMDQVSTQFAAEFERVRAPQVGNLINKVIDFVGPNNLRKVVEGTQFREASDPNIGDALQEGIGKAGVDVVRKTEVIGQDLETVVRETSAKLVGPSGARGPGPVARSSLRPGMNPGTELRKEFIKVHADNGVVPKEIRATQGVMIANVVIYFSQGVL